MCRGGTRQPGSLLDDVRRGGPEDHQVIQDRGRIAGPGQRGKLVPAAAAADQGRLVFMNRS
jgi:hypothetical protein